MFGKLLKKEIKELLNLGAIVSVIVIAVLYGSLGSVFESTIEKSTQKPKIAVVMEDTGAFSELIKQELGNMSDLIYVGNDLKEAEKAVMEKKASAIVLIPDSFSRDLTSGKKTHVEVIWYLKGTGISDSISTGMVLSLLEPIRVKIASLILGDPERAQFLFDPFTIVQHTYLKGKFYENRSPDAIMNIFYSQNIMIPILIMMLIIMSGSSLISSLALEKENKTLETLLTMPVKREHIVLAKILGSTIVGLILAGIYMVGFYNYLRSLTQNTQGIGMSFSATDLLLRGTSLFLSILAGLSLCMFLGMMAKDNRSAQILTFPISILALIPMIANMIVDFSNLPGALKVVIFAIPFSHPIMAPKLVFYGDYHLIVSGIIYLAVFSIIVISAAFRMFNSDYVVLGWQIKRRSR